jgi:hypothetical protein
MAALMMCSYLECPAERSGDGALDLWFQGPPKRRNSEQSKGCRAALATALHKKTAPPKIKKDGTVNVWLFLPSTVLTVSGSRGLLKNFELRNANFGFNNSTLQFAIRNPNFAILPGLSAASAAPPKRI